MANWEDASDILDEVCERLTDRLREATASTRAVLDLAQEVRALRAQVREMETELSESRRQSRSYTPIRQLDEMSTPNTNRTHGYTTGQSSLDTEIL